MKIKMIFKAVFVGIYVNIFFCSCFEPAIFDPESQQYCEPCNTAEDCCCGLGCYSFYNKQGVYNRCASRTTKTCKI